MVLHGANDARDTVFEADQVVSAIRAQGGDVEYLRFPDEGHMIRCCGKLSNRIIAYRRVAAFLERTLGRGPPHGDVPRVIAGQVLHPVLKLAAGRGDPRRQPSRSPMSWIQKLPAARQTSRRRPESVEASQVGVSAFVVFAKPQLAFAAPGETCGAARPCERRLGAREVHDAHRLSAPIAGRDVLDEGDAVGGG